MLQREAKAVGCDTRYTSFTATDYDMCSTVMATADESLGLFEEKVDVWVITQTG